MQRFARMLLFFVLLSSAACATLLDIVNRPAPQSPPIHGFVQAQDSGQPIAGGYLEIWTEVPVLN